MQSKFSADGSFGRATMRKVFLATTALEDFWDDTHPMLFLGEWCLLHRRKPIWKSLGQRVLPSILSDQEETERARSYVMPLYEDYLVRLSAVLNDIHAMQKSVRYWRIVLGPWLYLYLCVLYERYLSLRRAFEIEPKLLTVGLDNSCYVTPADTHEFLNWVKDDAYNLQIYTRLWQAMGMTFPVKTLSVDQRLVPATATRLPVGLSASLQRLILGGRDGVVLCSSYFPREVMLRFAMQTVGQVIPVRPCPRVVREGSLNRTSRRALGAVLPTNNDFETAVAHMFEEDIPRCFLEDFAAIGEAVGRHFPPSPKAILSASWPENEGFKRWAADSQESGTMLLGSQHGGNYGLLRYHPPEYHELSVMDRYYSWGWSSEPFQEKIVSMPAGILMGRKMLGADSQKKGILWGTTHSPRYPMLLWNDRFGEYLSWQARFLTALPLTLHADIRLRLHVEDGGWDIFQRLRDQGHLVKTEDWSRPFCQSLAECRLYVCDHLSTTFIEALSANKPTVLFWSLQAYDLRPDAVSYCEELKSAGMLFQTPEEAAVAVCAAYQDVEGWWNDPYRQSVRKRFCQKYGKTSPTAPADWVRELSTVLQGPDKRVATMEGRTAASTNT